MANKVYNMAGGLHSAAAYSAFEDALFGSCVANDSDFEISAGTGMNVVLSSGNGLISTGNGYSRRIAADSNNTIAITAASSSAARVDSIVAYIDNAVTPTTSVVDNTNDILKFVAVAGTAAANPVAPSSSVIQTAIGSGNPYMVLWNVTVPQSATALTGATFTDKRIIAANLAASRTALTDFNSADTITTIANVTIDTKDFTLAQSSDGSTFKFYGALFVSNSSSSSKQMTPVAVTGLSGYYGIDTGLTLNTAPSSGYVVAHAGTNAIIKDNAVMNMSDHGFAVGTNGHIYICVTTSSGGPWVEGNGSRRFFYPPCIYFNKNFGDHA